MAHVMYFVPGPLTFSWVKVIAKWYHENRIKTPLKVNHLQQTIIVVFVIMSAVSKKRPVVFHCITP